MRLTPERRAWGVFGALALLTVVVYWPALHGGYLFDDSIYFVDNTDLHVTSPRIGEWWRAAVSQCSVNLLCRPLSMLSLSANYFFTGLDPFFPKLTNLCIHLVNGLLVFLITRRLFGLRLTSNTSTASLAAALVAGAWLLLPINLSAVAYVSQRMECLATVFVLAGVLTYIRARQRSLDPTAPRAWLGAWISVVGWTTVGLLAKEDAALLPLFTFCIELAVFRFRRHDGAVSRSIVGLYLFALALPLLAGLVLVMPRLTAGVTQFRDFSVAERLLTEPRVIVDYIKWTLLPNLNELTFYHDDLAVSRSLASPATTLPAMAVLAALLAAAFVARRRFPLVCLGILWFFAGHVMTGTIIPLELVFEHRNYFSSIGLLIALAALLCAPGMQRFRLARAFVVGGCIVLYSGVTLLRAEEWSNPLRLAYAEALKRPQSQRAQYELARTLIVATDASKDSPVLKQAEQMIIDRVRAGHPSITSLQAVIFIAAEHGEDIDPKWWDQINDSLALKAPSQSDISALIFLYHCQRDGPCPKQDDKMYAAFVAALQASGGNVNLMSAYAEFALTRMHDAGLAERMFRDVVSTRPRVPVYRENLIRFYLAVGNYDAADGELEALGKLNMMGSLDDRLAYWRSRIAEARATAATPAAKIE